MGGVSLGIVGGDIAMEKTSMSAEIHNEIHGEIETFKRGLLKESLEKCTEDQQTFFHRIFPNGVSEDKLVGAIDLCRRTIKKNEAGRNA